MPSECTHSEPTTLFEIFTEPNVIQSKLLSENKLVICFLGNSHHQISIEKFEPEPRFEPRTSESLARRSNT